MDARQGQDAANGDAETKPLKLFSPAGGETMAFQWVADARERHMTGKEILDAVRFALAKHSELNAAITKSGLRLGEIDVKRYESLKFLCKRYNKAAKAMANLKKGVSMPSPNGIANSEWAPPELLKQVIASAYNRSVDDEKSLNKHYEAWSSQTYGETSFERMQLIIEELQIGEKDIFVDLGSGVGQLVVQVAGGSRVKKAIGMEIAELPSKFAKKLDKEFKKWMKWIPKKFRPYELHGNSNFLDTKFRDLILQEATVIFINNYAFTSDLETRIKRELISELKDGTRIVSTKPYAPLNKAITDRHMNDVSAILDVAEMRHCPNSVSWTSNDVPYYVHRVDRSKIEKYYAMLKNPALRQESSRKSSAQSSRNNSRESSVFREKDHRNGHRNGHNGASNGDDYACGPTTRRKWNEYVSELDQKKKRKGGEGSCRDGDPYVGTSNQYDSDDDADQSPSSMGSPNSQSGRKPKKQAKREGSAAKNGRGRPPKGGKSASEKADRSSKNQRLSAEAKEGIELMHQMSCAVSRGEDPAKLISEMTAAKRQAAFGNDESGPAPDRPTGLLPVPFPDVQLPVPDVTVNMVQLADRAIPSKYENLEAFLKDLRVLYESFLDSLHAPEFIHTVLQNNAEKAQSSSSAMKVVKTEPSTHTPTLVNGHAHRNDVDQALIATGGFMEASERIINYHQRIHAKLADVMKDIEACSQEMTRLNAMKREAEERVRTERHQKEQQKQQQEQSQQNLLRMMFSTAQQAPAAPVFSPTADPNQMLLAELAKLQQQQMMNQQNPLSQMMPYMDLGSIQAVTASLGLTQQLGGNPTAQQMQHAALQQQIGQLLGQQFGIDLSKIGGDIDLTAALQNAAMSLATGMSSTIPTSSNGVSSQLLPPTLAHIPGLSAAAAVASQMSPISQHVQPTAPPPPQQQRLPANIQATPTSSSAASGACSALPSSFSAAQQQQQSQYASAADGTPAPVSKKSRSRPSRSSGSKKNGVKEEGDPKHEEELEKQVQSIVKTALEVDQRAKSAEKDRKSRSSEKRKDKTPQQPTHNQSSASDSTPQPLDLNGSAESVASRKRTSSEAGLPGAPLPSPLLPPTISLPSAFTASSASTNTLTCLTSPITPTSTIGSGDMFPMPTSNTNSSSTPQLNFVPCSISLAISTNTLAKVESGAAVSAGPARSLNGNGGSAAYRQ